MEVCPFTETVACEKPSTTDPDKTVFRGGFASTFKAFSVKTNGIIDMMSHEKSHAKTYKKYS